MPKTDSSPTPDSQIRMERLFNEKKHFMEESLSIDKMNLTVTNIYPAFQKKSDQEIRQEISAKLYQIFKKYA